MKRIIKNTAWLALILVGAACSSRNDRADAYGNFEVDEITISAKTQGELLAFAVNEGDKLKAGQVIGYIDTIQLHLQRAELAASITATEAQKATVAAQIKVAKDELSRLQKDQDRIGKMYKQQAATQKQYDDINSAVDVALNNLNVLESQYPTIAAQAEAVQAKNNLLEQRIKDAVVINPINGRVLSKLMEQNEMAAPGKPIYKIAPMEQLNLRAFVSGEQLSALKLGESYTVKIDGEDEEMISYPGKLIWVAETAEFTPKTIQTKEDRVDLVYAIKIQVQNDGRLKLGMPGELWFYTAE